MDTLFFRWLMAYWLTLLVACGSKTDPETKTDGGDDTQPPQIVSTVPQEGEADVDPGISIQIVFNEAIDRYSLNSEQFHLEWKGDPLYGSVSYDLHGHCATLTMATELLSGETYVGVLEPGISDLEGNRITEAYRWSFAVSL